MRRFFLTLSCVLFLVFPLFGQAIGRDRFKLDSLQFHTSDRQEYSFYIKGGTQGLYIEHYYFGAEPRIDLNIINNTPDTLINRYKSRDGTVTWIQRNILPYGSKMAPGDTLKVYSGWQRRIGLFNNILIYDYTVRDSLKTKPFKIWGNLGDKNDIVNYNGAVKSKTNLYPKGHTIDKKKYGNKEPIKTYFSNGFIKTEDYPVNEYQYSSQVCGQITKRIFGNSDYSSPIVFDYVDGEIRSKTTPKFINRKTRKIPYCISKGKFNLNELYSGVIEFYNIDDQIVVSKKVSRGIQQEGFLYKGERYNLKDSLDRKEGKWITLNWRGGICSHYSIADYGCKFVGNITTYKNGLAADTSYKYYKSGKLQTVHVYPSETVEESQIMYQENGTIRQAVSYFKTDSSRFTYEVISSYSGSLPGCIVKKTIGKRNAGLEDYTYEYRDCKVHHKTSIQTEIFYDTTKYVSTEYIDNLEISFNEEIGFNLRSIPYTIEIGEFDDNELFLINGRIEYYDKNRNFIERKKVLNRMITKEE